MRTIGTKWLSMHLVGVAYTQADDALRHAESVKTTAPAVLEALRFARDSAKHAYHVAQCDARGERPRYKDTVAGRFCYAKDGTIVQ